jgi:hypothetical protein
MYIPGEGGRATPILAAVVVDPMTCFHGTVG